MNGNNMMNGNRSEDKMKAKTAAQLNSLRYDEFEDHVLIRTKLAFPDWEVEKQKVKDKYRLDILMSRGEKTVVIEAKHYKKSDLGEEEVKQLKNYMEATKANIGVMVVLQNTKMDEGIEELMEDEGIKLVRANYHLRAKLKKAVKRLSKIRKNRRK